MRLTTRLRKRLLCFLMLFLLIVGTGALNPILDPVSAVAPSGSLVNIITELSITDEEDNEVSGGVDPEWNWESFKLSVSFTIPGSGLSAGDYFYVDIPKKYFYDNVLSVADDLKLSNQSGNPKVGKYYVEAEADTYRLYVEFNGDANNYRNVSGFVWIKIDYNAHSSNEGEGITATFTTNTSIKYDWSFTAPGVGEYPSFEKYGYLLSKDDDSWFYEDNSDSMRNEWIDWNETDKGWCDIGDSHVMEWYISVNTEIVNGNINLIDPPIVTDVLGDKNGVGNTLHEYLFPEGYNILGIAVREYNNFAVDYPSGNYAKDGYYRGYTNLVCYVDDYNIFNDNLLNSFVTMGPGNKSASFDFSVFKNPLTGKLDKAYEIILYTKTSAELGIINESNFNQIENLKNNIINSVIVSGSAESECKVDVGSISHGSGAIGENYGYFTFRKVDTDGGEVINKTAKFNLYEGGNQDSFLYPIEVTGTYTSGMLSYGTYNLVETDAPDGYELNDDPVIFTIDATTVNNAEKTRDLGVITNTKQTVVPQTTSLTVKKEWSGDGTHPTSAQVQLYKDSVAEGEPVTLYAPYWTYTWNGLDAGNQWKVDEVDVPAGYEKSVTGNGNSYTITNTKQAVVSQTTSLTVNKVWDDNNDVMSRPAGVEVQLYKDAVAEGSPVTLDASNWKHIWENLAAGPVWTVKEVNAPAGYTSVVSGSGTSYVITNTKTASLTVNKVWDDNDDVDRPTSAKVQLYNGSTAEGEPVTLYAPDWTYTWDNLEAGRPWKVDEVDVPAGYDKSVTSIGSDYTITNTKQAAVPQTTTLTVNKDWDDNNDENRPASVQVQLYKDDVTIGSPVLLNAPDWTYTWNNLEASSQWKVNELDVPVGYDKSITRNGDTYTITNTKQAVIPTTSLTVNKVWDDNNDENRPASVEVQLYQDDTAVDPVVPLDASNWKHIWENLAVGPVWTVKEVNAPAGYTSVVSGSGTSYVITNTKTASLTVKKVWNDNDDVDRPTSAKVQLYNGSTAVGDPVTLTAPDWTYRWDNLEASLPWKVNEVDVPAGYDKSITSDGDTYTITNTKQTVVPQTATLTVKKVWAGSGTHPASVQVQLYKDDAAEGLPMTLTAPNWTHTWDNLEAGISWTVDEVDVPAGYDKSVTSSDATYTITNTKQAVTPPGGGTTGSSDGGTTEPSNTTEPTTPVETPNTTEPTTPTEPPNTTEPTTPVEPPDTEEPTDLIRPIEPESSSDNSGPDSIPPANDSGQTLEPNDDGSYSVIGEDGVPLGRLVPQEDGTYEFIDNDGVPIGRWSMDESDVWVYTEYFSLVGLPASGGVSNIAYGLLLGAFLLTLGILFGQTKSLRRRS